MNIRALLVMSSLVMPIGCHGVRAQPAPVAPATFDMTFDHFKAALDASIRQGADSIMAEYGYLSLSVLRECRQVGDVRSCTFDDRGFELSVVVLQHVRIMPLGPHRAMDLRVEVQERAGKVSRIVVKGRRSDPANLFQYQAVVLATFGVFDQKDVEGQPKQNALTAEAGIMRGNSSPDVGKPVMTVRPYATVKCITMPTNVTAQVSCEFLPPAG